MSEIRGTPDVAAGICPSAVIRSHRVVGQLEAVAQASGDEQVGKWTEIHRPHHQIAEPDAGGRVFVAKTGRSFCAMACLLSAIGRNRVS